jgi:hypothetical protein
MVKIAVEVVGNESRSALAIWALEEGSTSLVIAAAYLRSSSIFVQQSPTCVSPIMLPFCSNPAFKTAS